MPRSPSCTGAEYLAQWLVRKGVATVPGLPGSAVLPLYHALAETPQIRHILPRHEQGVGFIAQGMARASGRPAVCIATSGPGATNLVTPLADAYRDSVPVLAIVGQVATSGIGEDTFQEIDVQRMAAPIARAVHAVRRAEELPAALEQAWRQLTHGRPGPVLIELPKDVQEAWLSPDGSSGDGGAPDPAPAPAEAAVAAAAKELREARRPVLLLGGGAIAADAGEAARRLAEATGLPVVSTLMGLGALPERHPQHLGLVGMHGSVAANRAVAQADLLLVAGARLSDRTTGRLSAFSPHARIVQIDIDRHELGKRLPVDVPILADAGKALEALAAFVPARGWAAGAPEQAGPREAEAPDHPKGLIRELASEIARPTLAATDVGQHQMWAAQGFPFERPRQWLTSGGLGTMGFGLPAAIGASLARPDHRVLCLTSDGSLLMNSQELSTLAELQLDVHVVLFDNRALGLVRQQQDLFYGGRRYASGYAQPTDFCALARAFGVPAYEAPQEGARRFLAAALQEPGPSLLRIPVDSDEKVFPIVPPGGANRDALLEEPKAELDGALAPACSGDGA